ncbi:conjugative transposon protein TraN [Bacteroidia bacterium]|nr:conjugative transposon protein TraN [Bacteroidia bacterium]
MKRIIFICVMLCAFIAVEAQTAGDYYRGYSRKLAYDRLIPPYDLEVTYSKTVHVIFPSPVSYVDLGSSSILAGKAPGSENVIRLKAAVRGFETETNMSVITDDGSFYSFNVKYAGEPEALSVEMKDFLHDGEAVNRPSNALEIYLKELGNESPRMVNMINRSIYKNNDRRIRHIGSKRFGITFLLKGIYTHEGMLYLHTEITNRSGVPFDIDFIRMKVIDRKVAKRTAIQERVIYPLRAYNHVMRVGGDRTERTVFTIGKITLPDDRQLVIELFEKNGGRHQSFVIENGDIVHAGRMKQLTVR